MQCIHSLSNYVCCVMENFIQLLICKFLKRYKYFLSKITSSVFPIRNFSFHISP